MIEPNKANLHGQHCATYEKGTVGSVHAVVEAVCRWVGGGGGGGMRRNNTLVNDAMHHQPYHHTTNQMPALPTHIPTQFPITTSNIYTTPTATLTPTTATPTATTATPTCYPETTPTPPTVTPLLSRHHHDKGVYCNHIGDENVPTP